MCDAGLESCCERSTPDSVVLAVGAALKQASTDVDEGVTRVKAFGATVVVENRQVNFRRAPDSCAVQRPPHEGFGNAGSLPWTQHVDLAQFERPGFWIAGRRLQRRNLRVG